MVHISFLYKAKLQSIPELISKQTHIIETTQYGLKQCYSSLMCNIISCLKHRKLNQTDVEIIVDYLQREKSTMKKTDQKKIGR